MSIPVFMQHRMILSGAAQNTHLTVFDCENEAPLGSILKLDLVEK